jgi:hypothetical protein
MDSTRIKIGQVLCGQKEGSEDVALVKVESVGIGGINYNDTDNSFQYSFDELFGIPVAANVLLSSGFTLSNGLYVNDNISFIKIKQINGQWFWYADRDKCIMVKYLHELQGLYGDLTGNTLAVDEDELLDALESAMVLSAPTDFAASDTTPNTVTISWLEDADAEGYEYQIDDGAWVEVDVAEVELTGLTYSTTYKIRVKAIGDNESFVDSPESEEYSFTTAALIVLDAPADLTATEVGVNEITITWGEVANATEYEVQIGETTDTTDLLIYQFTSLDADTEYNISVKAVGDGITYDDSLESEVTETTDPLIVLVAPADLTATEVGENYVTVTWSAVANAAGYEVAVGETTDTVTAETLTYQFTSLDVNTGYTFSVKAVGDGITYDDSLESEVTETTLKEQLGAPVVAGETLSTTSVKFSWVAIANAGSYSYSIDNKETWTPTALLEITLTELTPSTSYTMLVKAIAVVESNFRDSDSGSGTVSTNA